MAEISGLLEILSPSPPPKDLPLRLRSDAVRPALRRLLELLDSGIHSGFDTWTDAQIGAVGSIARLVVGAVIGVSAWQVEQVVVKIVEKSIEFCVAYLEKSRFKGDDFSLQENILDLLELALVERAVKDQASKNFDPFSSLVEQTLTISVKPGDLELNDSSTHSYQVGSGLHLLKGQNLAKSILFVSYKHSELDLPHSTSADLRSSDSVFFSVRQSVVVHVKILPRVLELSRKMLQSSVSYADQMNDPNFGLRLSLSLKVVNLLKHLVKELGHVAFDVELLHAIAVYADTLPSLFKMKFDIVNHDFSIKGNKNGSILFQILEEFLHFVQIGCYDGIIVQNIKVCVLASLLDILDSKFWRYERASSSLRFPAVYCPEVVLFLLNLLKEVKRASQSYDSKVESLTLLTDNPKEAEAGMPVCHVRDEKVFVMKKLTFEKYLELIFPDSVQWIDNLMHLTFFLYSEGAKAALMIEKSHISSIKPPVAQDLDSTSLHEEEALFGNLFSEAARPVGAADGSDQSTVVVTNVSRNPDLPTQAATELLIFMRQCIFSPEWSSSRFDDACRKLEQNHINQLVPILNCHACICNEKNSHSYPQTNASPSYPDVHEACFELFHALLSHRAFSSSLKEHLVDEILKVEDGNFVYNYYTLSLLAHTLLLKNDLDGDGLTMRIFEGYVNFVLEKTNHACLRCSEPFDFARSLPNAFHLELVLMSYHLSNDDDKASLVNFVYSSLRKVEPPPPEVSVEQLFFWGLYMSRLVLVLRHVLLYQLSCPTWLIMQLRSRLTELPNKACHPTVQLRHMSSWVANVAESILGDYSSSSSSSVGHLLPQLIDVAPHPSPLFMHNSAVKKIGFNCDDLISTFSSVLRSWNGKKANTVDQLILERYIFSLCWDTISANNSGEFCTSQDLSQSRNMDLADVESFFSFGLFVISRGADIPKDPHLLEVLSNLLMQFQVQQLPDDPSELGWDFLRKGTWVSLVLFLIHSVLSVIPRRSEIHMAEAGDAQQDKPNEQLYIRESTISNIFQGTQVGWLLTTLSSILRRYLQILQSTFTGSLGYHQSCLGSLSHLVLLKHTGFDEGKCIALWESCYLNPIKLESICGLLSKFDDINAQEDTGSARGIVLRCLLHGFPVNSDVSSASLLSCILIVSGIISVLAEYFEVQDIVGSEHIDAGIISQLLGAVMAVKSDKIFQYIHDKCDVICDSLISQEELQGYQDLFILKQLEGFLSEANSNGAVDTGLYEMLIDSVVGYIETLRGDNSKLKILNFYLGCSEGMPKKAEELLTEQQGNLLILINALDNCHTETVNLKILNLFVDLLSDETHCDLKERLQKKFLDMDLLGLSSWLEKRFLGHIAEAAAGDSMSKGVSVSVRDSTMNFILSLISQPHRLLSKELYDRLTEAMLVLLERAFTLCDTQTAKAYLSCVLKLFSGEALKKLLEKTIALTEKLAGNEGLLPGLKVLIGFVGGVLGDVGANKSLPERVSTSALPSNSSSHGFAVPKSIIVRKNSDNLVLPTNQESGSASIDCDATSADEDDDDGTSDGELGSIEKDEEDDSNSERTLASKVCTFTSSGNNFMEQHWYFCYTCDLTVSKGCCSICAKVCHRGHRVVYSRSSRFFCDCGAGGVRGSSCQCLKPRKFAGSSNPPTHGPSNYQSFLPFSSNGDQTVDSDSDLDDVFMDGDSCFKLAIPKELQDELPALLVNLNVEARVLELCNKLIPAVVGQRESNLSKDNKVLLGGDKILSYNTDLFQLKKAYKGGSLDLKIKAEYPNSRELKSFLVCGSITKSLLTVSPRGRLAVGEGDKVSIFDVGQLIGQPTLAPVTADKTNVKPLSKNIVRFEIVHLIFNPIVENYLVVAGLEDCQVLTVNPRGEVTDRLALELALQGAHICKVDWVPGSQVQLMVVTNKFVKIYDLSQDSISPMHYFTLSDDMIADATLVPAPMGKAYLFVLSLAGKMFRLEVSMEGDVGARVLTNTIEVPEIDGDSKGLSLYFSSTYRILFLSFQDGNTLMARLDDNAMFLMETSRVYENEQDGKLRPAGLHHWKELLPGSGLFVCLSSLKSNVALSLSMNLHDLFAQNMRYGAVSSSSFVGIAAYKPLSKDKTYCLVLQDDGSLQIYAHIASGTENISSASAEQTKKLGPSILSNRAYAGVKPEFPLDFFERTMCITGDVKLSTDSVKNGDSEAVKQRLVSDDGFLEASTSAGFKVTVANCNPDIVMVGCRIHVGNTSACHIPSEVTIFQRVVKLDEGMRSWYDIPFTVAESLLADEEFTICVGPTFDGSTIPRIDSLEIYGRAKDEFGWKEKMEAVLDMEAHALGINSGPADSGRKCRTLQSVPIYEQVLADAIKLLSMIYSLCSSYNYLESDDLDVCLKKLRCRTLLETIFQSDREPLLQSSACYVLQSVFPKKEIYYRVKDTMRLLGVVNSFPVLVSRIGVGGASAVWVIKEFTSQMHAVSKIAVNRRSNMAAFLETHGSEVVDGLMQVLWGILDLERPETQTVNSIIIPAVELLYSYAECLALKGNDIQSVVPAVALLKKLLFAPYESVQTSSSLAISSRLLQVPFPKQTMLTTDDAAENTVSTHAPFDVIISNRNAPVMIEEDSATSSVQYCCDGCSTVPILRRRWHCDICPDFDLCEACYEVLDADQLPPPHSRDHPMSAIPIEIDSVGNDGSGLHFSVDELIDSSLGHANTDINAQNSSLLINAAEANDCGEFPASVPDQTVVSISASHRALNSLLLRSLIKELKGWMETTSGFRAIPIMQLFYRLSSAVGGPLMDSSKPENLDLEKLVKWLLDEINLNKPFPAKTRSSSGEVTILVFMFFTLMLRSWHQPGGDSSQLKSGNSADQDRNSVKVPLPTAVAPSAANDPEKEEFAAQLIRACSFLRQQEFLNYLMDILRQLVNIFKSSSTDEDSSLSVIPGCGSLLTVRRELPAGNFAPFFSDSYAKSHRSDIFMDYHKLLLENTFRLVYSLVRPEKQDKSGERDKIYKAQAIKELKLDEFQDVLCSYISNPLTSSVRRHARRLLLHLCGIKTQYYSIRDNWQFSNEVKKLYKLVNKSGGFQNPVPYERSVKLVKCLSAISEVAGARPRNWQKYCLKNAELLPFLLNGIFYFGEESVIQTLKILNLAFYTGKEMGPNSQRAESSDTTATSSRSGMQSSDSKKKRKADDGMENGSEKSCLDMEQSVEAFSKSSDFVLGHFIDSFLLEWNSSSVRIEAKNVLYGIWYHGKQSFGETLLTTLLKKVKDLPMYGQNILEYTELLTWLLGKVPDNAIRNYETEIAARCLTPEVISCIFETLHSQNELLANHPNSHIYNTLSGLVEFDGYYLESEPCVSCSCPEVPYSRMKLESLKSETKFTDNRIIVKCTGSYTIQSVTMNVHEARKSKTVKILNLYYNNRAVGDLSELKNNWSLWKRAKSCHLAFNQTELKVEFAIPITACNFMIELDSFYENLQASSLESLQCPRCSRSVTDKHGICSNCHENAYQCRQCRNINYENLDSFLCNECGYSKYGRFEFNFMAKPSFSFDCMENDEDMKKGLAAIESESENAHRRYQQLLGFKKPLLKLVSSIGENEIDSQHKDSVQQMMVSIPGPSCKINRKIALLGVLYGEKCKTAFDSVSKSVQTLQGLRRVLLTYLHQKNSNDAVGSLRFSVPRSPNNCYGCATTFVTQCLELLQVLSKHTVCKKQLVSAGILKELFENNIHQGPKTARVQARAVLCALSDGDAEAVSDLNTLIQKKVMYCLEHHRSMDIALATREELLLLSETCSLVDEHWEARLRVAFRLLFASIKLGAKHPAISEHIILPCLRIISQACTPPRSDNADREQVGGKSTVPQAKNDQLAKASVNFNATNPSKSPTELVEKHWSGVRKGQDIPLLSYSEWERGASYIDFVRRQYKVSQAVKGLTLKARQDPHRIDYLALKYALKWRRRACTKATNSDFSTLTLGSWVSELILSACSQSIRSEVCTLVSLICPQNTSRRFQLLNLLMSLLPATLAAGESAAEYFELFFKMIDSETSRLYLTVRGCLTTICKLITQEVCNVESQEMSLSIDISQGFILHKLIELLSKFLEVPNIRVRFMHDELLSDVLEALLVIRGLVVQKTKLISDCNRLLKELLDSLLYESTGNKRQFIRACISGLQNHKKERKGRTSLFILEQLCNLICPSKPEPVYLLVLNKAHTQEEFIRGSMTKNPYSSNEIGPLMRDVKNKICHQLDLLGLLEDDYSMELLVAGNIISLDLSISQVYEQIWKKYHSQSQNTLTGASVPSSTVVTSVKDCPPMTVTYRLQGLDGEATEPMIKELEEEREESQDPEVEFAIAGAVRECGGLEIILGTIQNLRDDELKSNKEELGLTLYLLMYCCKIRENRRALLQLGALGLLLETARRAFSVEAMEPAEGILLIVESLTIEANESDIGINLSVLTVTNEESGSGEQAKKIVLMFLERLCHPLGVKKSSKQQRNNEMVARILPYLTYGQPEAMESLVQHFNPYLQDWREFDHLQQKHQANPEDKDLAQDAIKYRSTLENFIRVSESLKSSSCGERLKDIILEKGITAVAVRHLRESFAVTGQAGFKSTAEWSTGLTLPSVPLILSMLRGLSKGHLATQKCIDEEGILPLLHALEGVTGENEIGARAENLLDTLSDKESNGDGFLGDKIHKLRHATRDEMRRRALRRREQLLQGLGMRQEYANDGGERIVVTQPVIEGLEDVEEEDGLACMVCREGYTLRPNDMLGVYCYSKRVNLGASSSSSGRSDCVYTTVSHFNVIHFQCHQEAKRADAALRNPKKEWEGATLRNNETLCNCIFPLRGPSVPLSQYARCVDQYWDNLNALGRADGSRLRLLTYDIVLMLARFATGASFSTDSRGGGRESNSHFLPFMIQMASYLLDQGSSNQQRRALAKSVSAYLSNTSTTDSPSRVSSSITGIRSSGTSDETVQFMMVNSLLSESYEDWLQHRPAFLQRGIYHAYMQHKHGKSSLRVSDTSAYDEGSSTDFSDGKKLFAMVQPMLIFTGLIEQLQKFFKFSKAASTVSPKESAVDASSGVERWEIVMKEKMVNVKEMVGFSKELLSWLEDMTSSSDLQEAFDVMGVLADVLAGGNSRCEDFVQAAILAAKS